jgi:hypothetical protein
MAFRAAEQGSLLFPRLRQKTSLAGTPPPPHEAQAMNFRAADQGSLLFPRLRQKTSFAAPPPPAHEDPFLVQALGEVPYFAAVALLDVTSLCH